MAYELTEDGYHFQSRDALQRYRNAVSNLRALIELQKQQAAETADQYAHAKPDAIRAAVQTLQLEFLEQRRDMDREIYVVLHSYAWPVYRLVGV